MNIEKLSRRLECVYNYIPEGSTMADIGSDHAYLPCYAINHKKASFAIAGEVVEGPYQSAVDQVKRAGLQSKVSVRKGDGLDVLSPGEVDCITIAGMGGALIASILERGKEKLADSKRLVLQPNMGSEHIRSWCLQNGWDIIAEEILEEDGKIYEIIVVERALPAHVSKSLNEMEILMGPFLLEEKNEAFKKKWTQELDQWQSVLNQLDKALNSDEVLNKKKALIERIEAVKEALL
ncbi:tRNA (adenine(22)-N(1))-methyltransferase [Heyndrickxia acidicola]|uniref:tRNA (Adenine(22)-N(1))-methyltransferase TrmK n=1 Tax=Heyndrickxia acidicola TaxID=209389 RepID=A0ABU6MPY5_9BACI|nr:tRNA (adenine(22)-N(1))-methyltransferase TrmK [Heyndrickxia acidicola]MED1205110.1 tRNA (adenine(22)-N(1))-methyltransferase TrmK [Heyndrickxia acidicola]